MIEFEKWNENSCRRIHLLLFETRLSTAQAKKERQIVFQNWFSTTFDDRSGLLIFVKYLILYSTTSFISIYNVIMELKTWPKMYMYVYVHEANLELAAKFVVEVVEPFCMLVYILVVINNVLNYSAWSFRANRRSHDYAIYFSLISVMSRWTIHWNFYKVKFCAKFAWFFRDNFLFPCSCKVIIKLGSQLPPPFHS